MTVTLNTTFWMWWMIIGASIFVIWHLINVIVLSVTYGELPDEFDWPMLSVMTCISALQGPAAALSILAEWLLA